MNSNRPFFYIEDEFFPLSFLKESFDGRSYDYLLEHEYLKVKDKNAVFKFVGIVSFGSELICVLPKYYSGEKLSDEQKTEKFKTIIRVLKKVEKFETLPDTHYTRNADGLVSEILIADFLLKDYLEHGFFEKKTTKTERNVEGEINWSETINLSDPIFSNKRPIYHDLYNYVNITEDYNLITELHKWCVKYCLVKYGNILGYNITYTADTIASYKQLGEIEYLLLAIEKEIRISYLDRIIRLLKNMFNLIKQKGTVNNQSISLFGTGYFHVVWEKVCSHSFKNIKSQFTHLIPQPQWHNLQGMNDPKETIDPDIVCFNSDQSSFFILDAKYYNIKIEDDPFKISGNPGVGDITKQILYEKAFLPIPALKRYNLLLFPGLINSFFEIKGFITFDLLPGHKVYNVLLSPDEIFESYLQNDYSGHHILEELSDEIDKIQ